MKWAVIGVLTLGALGCWAMSLGAAGSLNGDVKPMQLPRVVMRPLPELRAGPAKAPVAVAMRDTAPAQPAKVEAPPPKPEPAKPEPVAEKPAEKPKPEPVAEKPAEKPKPEPVAEKPARPEPVAEKPVEKPKPEPKVAKEPAEPKEPKAPKPPPEEKETSGSAPSAPAPAGDGLVNLKASDTAEIVIDGRKVGPSPKLGYKLKAGKHKIRFDCYDENGNLKPGKVQTVEVKPDDEHTIEYECPFSQ